MMEIRKLPQSGTFERGRPRLEPLRRTFRTLLQTCSQQRGHCQTTFPPCDRKLMISHYFRVQRYPQNSKSPASTASTFSALNSFTMAITLYVCTSPCSLRWDDGDMNTLVFSNLDGSCTYETLHILTLVDNTLHLRTSPMSKHLHMF